MVNRRIALHFFVLLLVARSALSAPLEVRVTLLSEDRLPRLSDEQVRTVLDTAQKMLARGYDAQVRFRLDDPIAVRQFFDVQRRRIAPYTRPTESYNDIFSIETLELHGLAVAGCRRYGTVHQLRTLFLPAEREQVTSHVDAARLLVQKYKQRIGNIRRLTDATGKLLITPDNVQDSSLAHWESLFATSPWGQPHRLYLANTILVDDLRAFAPHSMVTGIANGVSYPVVNAAIVAYHPILSGDAAIATHRLGNLTDDERLAVIAYVIAHEIGAHLIKNESDDYRDGAGLARPIAAITDRREILGHDRWRKRQLDPRPLDIEGIKWWMCDLRLDVCIARNDPFGAMDVLELVSNLKVDSRYKQALKEKFERARWREE